MTDDEMYNQAVEECFTGDVPRDCDNCIASPQHGGRCCFAEAYNPVDKECRDCLHRPSCAAHFHGSIGSTSRVTLRRPSVYAQPSPVRRVPITNTPPIVRQASNQPPNLIPTTVHRTPAARPKEEKLAVRTEEPFMKRLGRVTGWGMVEGGLQMALNFFQRNRPE